VKFENGVTSHFDLLHIVPPQRAHSFVAPLAADSGFVDVNKDTLRHNKYPNVFALGDVANLPTSKTAAAIFSQAPVVVHNLTNVAKQANYNGYSSCPVFVGSKKLMLMEFKYGGIPDETFLKSQDKPRIAFYWFKKYLFPFVYWNFVPKGIWFGRNMFFKPKF
jgi:sulfide:quinone oxidoreductase